ncbi:MAG: PBP1A family penicillin-binding protein [Fusobacteria bacterium]|nr:PBP1A family penicillin-binding protein [Fusobacteriota bacterium]
MANVQWDILIKRIIQIVVVVIVLILIVAGLIFYKAYRTLPNISNLVENYTISTPTIMYDENGQVIDTISVKKKSIVNIKDIPSYVANASVAIEDHNFYHENGFNIERTVQSALINIVERRYAQGGSTITQQLARNAFLNMKKNIFRKVQEAIITVELERKYTKPEILDQYLNVIYYGGGVYGIDSASELYFGIHASELSVAQAAFLAGIPNNPSMYSPYSHLDAAMNRQKIILKKMLQYHYITKEQYEVAIKTPINVISNAQSNSGAAAFTDIVENILTGQMGFTDEELYTQGLKIYTTMNLQVQSAAQSAVNSNFLLQSDPKLQVGMVAINSQNGYVEAMIGGKNYRSGLFNRAISANRQPGSSFKPYLYLAALEQGVTMNTLFEDSPITISGGLGGKDYTPTDAEAPTMTNITLVTALENSVNIVAVKLLQKIGYGALANVEKQIGFPTITPNYPSVALGAIAMTPFQQATNYCVFSNGGYKVTPMFITKVEDKYGNILYQATPQKTQVVDSKYVALLTFMLEQVVKSGTGMPANIPGVQMAGKTGTTNNSTDTWFVGYTGDLVTAIWEGYDDSSPMKSSYYGNGVSAPLWHQMMAGAIANGGYTPVGFGYIQDLLQSNQLVLANIDSTTGLLADGSTPTGNIQQAMFLPGQVPNQSSFDFSHGLNTTN